MSDGRAPRAGRRRQRQTQEADQRISSWIWTVALLALVFAAAVRLRLLEVPLERDEGEYAYVGQLILQGIPPYRLAYSVKFPGTAAAYAAIMAVFGQTATAIHGGLLIVNGLTVLLVLLLGRRLLDARVGAVAGATYAVLSLSPSVLGTAAHATHFVVLAALGGLVALLIALESRSTWTLLVSGLLVGLATLMKQSGVFYVVFAVAYLVWHERRIRRVPWTHCIAKVGLLASSAAVPLGVMCLVLLWAGVFDKFWFWTVAYGGAYGSQFGLSEALSSLWWNVPLVVRGSWPLWALGGVGLGLLWRGRDNVQVTPFLVGLSLSSLLAVCPGFYFRQHYFILLLPSVALLSGVAIRSGTALLSARGTPSMWRHAPVLLLLAAFSYSIWTSWEFLGRLPPRMASRWTYDANPFSESIEVSRYIRSRSTAGDRIAVIGSEPQIYFLSGRQAATGYLYTYPLMEAQPYAALMQREMIDEIERARPEFVVGVNVAFSWLPKPSSQRLILDWAKSYVAQHFRLVGVVDIVSRDHTEYRWDDDAANYVPRSRNVLLVYRRKGLT